MSRNNSNRLDFWRLLTKVIIGLAIISGIQVWQRVRVDALYRQISELEKQLTKLEHANSQLNTRLGKLKDFRRISEIAKKDLGLVFPEKQIIHLDRKQNDLIARAKTKQDDK